MKHELILLLLLASMVSAVSETHNGSIELSELDERLTDSFVFGTGAYTKYNPFNIANMIIAFIVVVIFYKIGVYIT